MMAAKPARRLQNARVEESSEHQWLLGATGAPNFAQDREDLDSGGVVVGDKVEIEADVDIVRVDTAH